ncbi:hypothetical protein D3C85_1515790 [compost metagenome]
MAKLSFSGVVEPLPSAFIFLNEGLSASFRRIHSETPSSRIETMKGMRQPQSRKASSPTAKRTPRMTARLSTRPAVAVIWMKEV